jgi:hypothetical protein
VSFPVVIALSFSLYKSGNTAAWCMNNYFMSAAEDRYSPYSLLMPDFEYAVIRISDNRNLLLWSGSLDSKPTIPICSKKESEGERFKTNSSDQSKPFNIYLMISIRIIKFYYHWRITADSDASYFNSLMQIVNI